MATPILFNYNIDPTVIGQSVLNAPNAMFGGNFQLSVTYAANGTPIISVVSSTLKTDTFGTSTTNSVAQQTGVVDSKFDASFTNVGPCSSFTAINANSDHDGVLVTTNAKANTVTMTFDAPATYTTGSGANATDYNRLTFTFYDDALFDGKPSEVSSHIAVTNLSQSYWTADGCGDTISSVLAQNDKVVIDESIPCYVQGTLIATANGLVAVEDLRPGDQVLTVEGKMEPVIWLGHHTIHCQRQVKAEKAYPVCIQKDAFETNVPNRDLYLSPDHSIYIDGVMIPAFCLLNGLTILQTRTEQLVTYYHVELPGHQVIYAEGLMAESYLETSALNRSFFRSSTERSNVHAIAAQYPPCPEGVEAWRHIWDTQGYAKLVMSGPVLESVKMRLQRRSEQLLNLFRIAA